MTEVRTHRCIGRSSKKNAVPLSKLRTSEAVKTVVNHPRRIEELIAMFQDKERVVRGRAAATLARLSESHPGRLLRLLDRILEALGDDSAFVRWHAVYCLGCVGRKHPGKFTEYLPKLADLLDDENRIVRMFTARALGQIALRKRKLVEDFFKDHKRELPAAVARILQGSNRQSEKPGKRL
jgi:HEAT repeat protein